MQTTESKTQPNPRHRRKTHANNTTAEIILNKTDLTILTTWYTATENKCMHCFITKEIFKQVVQFYDMQASLWKLGENISEQVHQNVIKLAAVECTKCLYNTIQYT